MQSTPARGAEIAEAVLRTASSDADADLIEIAEELAGDEVLAHSVLLALVSTSKSLLEVLASATKTDVTAIVDATARGLRKTVSAT